MDLELEKLLLVGFLPCFEPRPRVASTQSSLHVELIGSGIWRWRSRMWTLRVEEIATGDHCEVDCKQCLHLTAAWC